MDELTVITRNGREYGVTNDGSLYKLKDTGDKFIGWLDNGVYTPSNDIQVKRNKIESEARKRLAKAKFEDAVKKRMDELRGSK
jgi:hypothetical protein